jgi:hypothetical protein
MNICIFFIPVLVNFNFATIYFNFVHVVTYGSRDDPNTPTTPTTPVFVTSTKSVDDSATSQEELIPAYLLAKIDVYTFSLQQMRTEVLFLFASKANRLDSDKRTAIDR